MFTLFNISFLFVQLNAQSFVSVQQRFVWLYRDTSSRAVCVMSRTKTSEEKIYIYAFYVDAYKKHTSLSNSSSMSLRPSLIFSDWVSYCNHIAIYTYLQIKVWLSYMTCNLGCAEMNERPEYNTKKYNPGMACICLSSLWYAVKLCEAKQHYKYLNHF